MPYWTPKTTAPFRLLSLSSLSQQQKKAEPIPRCVYGVVTEKCTSSGFFGGNSLLSTLPIGMYGLLALPNMHFPHHHYRRLLPRFSPCYRRVGERDRAIRLLCYVPFFFFTKSREQPQRGFLFFSFVVVFLFFFFFFFLVGFIFRAFLLLCFVSFFFFTICRETPHPGAPSASSAAERTLSTR